MHEYETPLQKQESDRPRYIRLGNIVVQIVREPTEPMSFGQLLDEEVYKGTIGIQDKDAKNRQARVIENNLRTRAGLDIV